MVQKDLIEMNRKHFEKDRKSFGTVLKIWLVSTCGRAAFLETLQLAVIFK